MFSQFIYIFLSTPSAEENIIHKLFIRAAYTVRDVLVRICHDPLIKYNIGKFVIHLPLSHPLGIFQAYSEFLTNQGRICACLRTKYKELSVIVVGANVGDGVALIKNYADVPILAIEGEKNIFSILQLNTKQFQDVNIVNAFVSEKNEGLKGKLVVDGGTAYFSVNEEGNHLTSVQSLGNLVKENMKFFHSKLVVIDTDGFDCKIIRGAAKWLSEVKPIIFFEYDPYLLHNQGDDGISIFKTLSSIGYESLLFYFNTGEYFCSASLADTIFLEEIHEYASGRKGQFYFDICAFSAEDMDVCERIRSFEREYFRTIRGFGENVLKLQNEN